MSTIVRRKRTRAVLGPYKRHELLTGEIEYPVYGYTGYGDGVGTELMGFIGAEMRRDWTTNREELVTFWKSGAYTTTDIFPDSLPWLFVCGSADTLPWAASHLD